MSQEKEPDIKSQLNKHINTRLFKKFWDKESARFENTRQDHSLKIPSHLSPPRARRSLNYSSDDELPSERRLNKSISQRSRDFQNYSRQTSPLKNPFIYQDENLETIEYSNPRVSWKDTNPPYTSSVSPAFTNYYQVIPPQTIQAYEEVQSKLKNDLISVKEKYESILQRKNSDLKSLQKTCESLKKQLNEQQSQISILEDKEKKLENFKSSNEILQRKLSQVEAEAEGFRRQLDYTRETCETYKNQIEDHERIFRSRSSDVERDVRMFKDRVDELQRILEREKDRNEELERRLIKSKEKIFALESELVRAEDRNKRLEKEVFEVKDRVSRESTQQLRETEYLRRKIEDLTHEVIKSPRKSFYDSIKHEPYEEPNFSRSYTDRTDRNRAFRSDDGDQRTDSLNFRTFERPRPIDPERNQMKEILSPKPKPQENLKSLETKLMNMQIEKKRLEDDLSKIPPLGRKLAQIKRQQEIELELEILNSNINAIKGRLRHFNVF